MNIKSGADRRCLSWFYTLKRQKNSGSFFVYKLQEEGVRLRSFQEVLLQICTCGKYSTYRTREINIWKLLTLHITIYFLIYTSDFEGMNKYSFNKTIASEVFFCTVADILKRLGGAIKGLDLLEPYLAFPLHL